jgi:hypothetical protein
MGKRLKSYVLIALGIGAFYFLLSHHIIFSSFRDFDILKKEELTMEYTFCSVRSTPIEEILANDILMDAGIEKILLDRHIITEEELGRKLERINARRARDEDSSE